MVAEVELPEGYHGKSLLVLLTCGGFERVIWLRAGNAWHREILANTRAEIKDLGFQHTHVDSLGGDSVGDLFFYAFDLLYFDGLDLCGLPLLERKAVLRTVLPPSPRVLFPEITCG